MPPHQREVSGVPVLGGRIIGIQFDGTVERLFRAGPVPIIFNFCVYYRYGGFRSAELENADGTRVYAVRNPEGVLVPDIRGPDAAVPAWTTDPFPQRHYRRKKASSASPLKTTFRAYGALVRRGKGGVYRALDLSVIPPRFCVLKEGRPHGETDWEGRDGCWRVRHEEHVLSSLSNEGIRVPAVYASFEVEGHRYLVAEFIEGDNLHSLLLNRKKKLPIAETLRYGIQLAELLSGIHAAGWVWRDCKPLNLIVAEGGLLRPIDFEGACRADAPDSATWGTPAYMPPEQRGSFAATSCVPQDLYALGITLHQLFSGQVPDPSKRLAPIGRLRRGVPPAVRKVLTALLQPQPQIRPNAQTVFEELGRAYAALA